MLDARFLRCSATNRVLSWNKWLLTKIDAQYLTLCYRIRYRDVIVIATATRNIDNC